MELLTNSRLKSYRACPRQHHYLYDLGYRPVSEAPALAFGTAVHRALEVYWRARQAGDGDPGSHAIETLDHCNEGRALDSYQRARALAMVAGYCASWDQDAVEVLAVEREFRFPLLNPGAANSTGSRTFEMAGKIDLLVRLADGRTAIVEHKCVAGDARILDHSTGTYERAADLFARGTAPLVTAVDATGAFVRTRALPLREASVRPIFCVTTRGGRSLRVSGNHPVLTPSGWAAAEQLSAGDWVATPRHMPSAVPDAPMSDEAVRLVGYMIGDGSLSNMSFTKNDTTVIDDVVRCAAHEGEPVNVRHPDQRAAYVRFSRVGPVSRVMARAGFTNETLSADKRIPFHLALSDRQLGQLVGALWSTDGCVDAFRDQKLRIIYTSVSRGLCLDIQHALQRLGIVSNVRTTSVAYGNERRPVSTVNIVSRGGRRRFLALAVEGVIPVLRSAVPIAEAHRLIPDSKQGNDACKQPTLDSSIWWDRVESIERQGEEMTYDVEVPGAHTFVVDGIVTHNTTSEDPSLGSSYRARLAMDGQVSTYFAGTDAIGMPADLVLYDVLVKPSAKPLLATPVENRRYTKAGTLDARQRETDETPEAYGARCAESIGADPDRYYARIEVVRLEGEMRDYAFDVWQLARQIRDGERLGAHPRNPDACFRFGSPCAFWDACTGAASLDDPTRFRRAEKQHEELTTAA
jgi:hypothetical protein